MGTTGPTGTAGATGAAGATGPTGPSSYNTAFTYNAQTSVLSITDGGGTLTTNITPMRASISGTTNITTTSSTFATMAGTTLTFTPNKSTVYFVATAAGYADPTATSTGYVGVELVNTGTGAVIAGAGSLCISIDGGSFTTTTSWSVSTTGSMAVTPGVPVTVALKWHVQWADGGTYVANCAPNTDPESHRSIVVFE